MPRQIRAAVCKVEVDTLVQCQKAVTNKWKIINLLALLLDLAEKE